MESSVVIDSHPIPSIASTPELTIASPIKRLEERVGHAIEYSDTAHIFTAPPDPRTEVYINGRIG